MSEHIITGANDVELVLESETRTRGIAQDIGRILVDEFSITREEDDTLESGVGHRNPQGIVNGDITHSWSFTMMGQDVETFDMVATADGTSRPFSFTARKTDENGNIEWEYALQTCKTTSEEVSGSSGDAMEYAVEGIAVGVDKVSDTTDAWN